MTLNFIQIILVLIVSFLAGMEGILDDSTSISQLLRAR